MVTSSTYFDIQRDIEIVNAGGFFCSGCLKSQPLDDISSDPRYCLFCYDVLTKEVGLAQGKVKGNWQPMPEPVSGRVEVVPVQEKLVAKPSDKGIAPVGVMQHAGGRPRKEGEVHRTTEWRRQKAKEKEIQGVLI